jgi:hypothetical protein
MEPIAGQVDIANTLSDSALQAMIPVSIRGSAALKSGGAKRGAEATPARRLARDGFLIRD